MTLPNQPIGPHNRLGLRVLARDSFFNFFRQGIAIAMGLLISILLARGLGREARGMFTISILLAEVLITFFNFGLVPAGVFFISRGEFSAGVTFRQNTALALWISAFTILMGVFLIAVYREWLFPNIPVQLLLISLFIIPINFQNRLLGSIFQGLQDFRRFNIPSMLSQFIYLLLILLLVWWVKLGVLGALLAYLSGAIFSMAIFMWLIHQKIRPLPPLVIFPDMNYIKKVFSFGFKAHISNLLGFLSYRLDNFLLNQFKGPGNVGIYAVAVGLGERLWLPAEALSTALFPRIASYHDQQEKRKIITPMMLRFVLAASIPVTLLVGLLAHWFVPLLYGEEFSASVLPLYALLPGILVFNVSKILANDLAGRGRVDINLIITGIGTALNICANLIMIPKFGAVGAAAASAISYSLVAGLFIFRYTRITDTHLSELLFFNKRDWVLVKRAIIQARSSKWSKKN